MTDVASRVGAGRRPEAGLLRNGSFAIVIQGVGAVLSLGLLLTLGLRTGDELGRALVAVALLQVTGMLCSLGVAGASLRTVPALLATGDELEVKRFVAQSVRQVVLAGGALLALSPVIGIVIFGGVDQGLAIAATSAVAAIAAATTILFRDIGKALGREIWALGIVLVFQPGVAVALIWGCGILDGTLSAEVAMALIGGSQLASAVVLWVVCRHELRSRHGITVGLGDVRLALTRVDRGQRSLSNAILASNVLGILLTQGDLLAAPRLLGADGLTGYATASRLAAVGTVIMVAVNGIATPGIARAYVAADKARGKRLLAGAMLITSVPSLALCVGGILMPGTLARLVGDNGAEVSTVALQVLLLARFVNSACGPSGGVLQVSGRHWDVVKCYATVTVAVAIALLVMRGHLGPAGLAWVWGGAMAAQNAALLALVVYPRPLWWWARRRPDLADVGLTPLEASTPTAASV